MSKKSLFFLAMLMICVSLQAQFRAGVKAGVNIADMSFEANSIVFDIYKPRTGFHGGLFAEYMFDDRFGLQSELSLYSVGVDIDAVEYLKGMEDPLQGLTLQAHVSMNTLQWPVCVKFKADIAGNVNFYAMGGGFFSYSFDAAQHMKMTNNGESLNVKFDLHKPEIYFLGEQSENSFQQKKSNAGLIVEAGIEINRKVAIGVNYRQVLGNMAGQTTTPGYLPQIKMWIASLSIGYYL